MLKLNGFLKMPEKGGGYRKFINICIYLFNLSLKNELGPRKEQK